MSPPNIETRELPDWRQGIHALEAEHCRAFVARDYELLDRLWSDDLVVNSPINRVLDKQRVLELLRAGIISHTGLECQVESLQRHGPFVVAMGSELVTNSPGEPQLRRRYTNLWREAGGSWQLVARHANIISD